MIIFHARIVETRRRGLEMLEPALLHDLVKRSCNCTHADMNFPPALGFTHEMAEPTTPMMSAIQGDLPPNIKLKTISNNYARFPTTCC